jgi:hypothetical protein
MYCIGQKPGLATIQPLETALLHTGRQSYGRSVDIGSHQQSVFFLMICITVI